MRRSASGVLNSAIGAAVHPPHPQKLVGTPVRTSLRGDEDFSLASVGVQSVVHRNLPPSTLYEWALKEKGTHIAASGALSVRSGTKTGRSPKDKRIVDEAENTGNVWWGTVNIKMDEDGFLRARERAIDYLNSVEQVFVFDGYAGWHPDHQIKIRVISSRAYHALFMHNMLIRPTPEQLADFGAPDYVIYNSGVFPCNRLSKGMTSATSVSLHLARKEFVILGTQYAGEMKKGVFTIMNYIMPLKGVLSLHSSCNVGPTGDVTVFFGLSGTGKTTLSADPSRSLIGDDEHCWCDDGVFNVEGGCYAKCIGLTREKEPFLWDAIRFGTVVENVDMDEYTREFDFESDVLTENTRAAYPIEFISNSLLPCVTGHPRNIIMLACDAFGVLPPVSRLSDAQAMYHFISGYTARVAGTEVGVKEPQAVFSACFGAPFMVWHPSKYAEMLAQKMREHNCTAWLINTGWTGGAYGHGSRIKLAYTRSIIDAINNGLLVQQEFVKMPRFGFDIPVNCAGVPSELLQPWMTWSSRDAYDTQLLRLTEMFNVNFTQFEDKCTEAIRSAGPTLDGEMPEEHFKALFQKMSLSGGFG